MTYNPFKPQAATESGQLVTWLVKDGSTVTAGDAIAKIKPASRAARLVELRAAHTGKIQVVVKPGFAFEVGEVVAYVDVVGLTLVQRFTLYPDIPELIMPSTATPAEREEFFRDLATHVKHALKSDFDKLVTKDDLKKAKEDIIKEIRGPGPAPRS